MAKKKKSTGKTGAKKKRILEEAVRIDLEGVPEIFQPEEVDNYKNQIKYLQQKDKRNVPPKAVVITLTGKHSEEARKQYTESTGLTAPENFYVSKASDPEENITQGYVENLTKEFIENIKDNYLDIAQDTAVGGSGQIQSTDFDLSEVKIQYVYFK